MGQDENDNAERSDKSADVPIGHPSVFFSYSRDDQTAAIKIIKKIEAEGYSVWWDGLLQPGTNFLETTEAALESAKVVIVLWSKTSIGSHWVRDEATSGRKRDCLIPLSLDGTTPPLGFRQVQVINVEQWESDPRIFDSIIDVLSRLNGRPDKRIVTAKAHQASHTKAPSRRSLLKLGLLGAGALTIGGGASFLVKQRLSLSEIFENGIVVLPFENLINDPDYDYIANGLSSEIRNTLAQNPGLQVVARSSSQAIVDDGLSAQLISKKLNVAYVLEGAVSRANNGFRVSIDFVDGRTGFSELAKTFDFGNDDVLTLYNDIKQALIDALTRRLEIGGGSDPGQTENALAFNEYLKGQNLLLAQLDTQTINRAISHYETALDLDSNFGLAHVARAQLFLWQGISSSDHDESAVYLDKAVASAKRAVTSSPGLVDAHSVLGYILFTGKMDIAGAKPAYSKAFDIGLTTSAAFARYAVFLATTGQDRLALDNAKRAAKLDPLNPTSQETLGLVHFAAGRFEDAITAYESVKQQSPNRYNVNARLGLSYIFLGEIDKGLEICVLEQNDMERLPCLAIGAFRRGDKAAAQNAMDTLVETFGDRTAYQQAQIWAQWGDTDKALSMLQKAKDLGDTGLTLALIDPALDPLRQSPDFLKLLADMGFRV